MTTWTPSEELAQKAVAAAVASIEVYNKPDFYYREETFAILMANAWELLLKGKFVKDNDDDPSSVVEFESPKSPVSQPVPKLNRSGNPITFGLTYLLEKLYQDKLTGLTKDCHLNVLLLIEVRDNAVHFVNKDLHFSKRIQEIGTASLRNFLSLSGQWFGIDLSKYNFFLMPLSFYHGFEAAQVAPASKYNDQMTRFLQHVDSLEEQATKPEEAVHHVTLRVETTVKRSREAGSMPFRITSDPNAPAVQLREEDLLVRYPYDYFMLTQALRNRYTDFVVNNVYHRIKKGMKTNSKYCHRRFLNPKNERGGYKEFYSLEVFKVFDQHYSRKPGT